MSLTRAVPAAVPSVFQSSRPWSSSLAAKKVVAPTAAIWPGDDPRVPGLTFLSSSGVAESSARLSSASRNRARDARRRAAPPADCLRRGDLPARWDAGRPMVVTPYLLV